MSDYTVFFFSGTGNSRYVAKKIASATEGKLISVNEKIKKNDLSPIETGKNIVLAAPVYAWRIPRVVQEWFEKVEFIGAEKIWYALTCGSEIGNAGAYCRKLSDRKGLADMGTAGVVMPCNHISMFDVPDEEKAKKIIADADPVIESICRTIAAGEHLPEHSFNIGDSLRSGLVTPMFYPAFIKSEPFKVEGTCIGCGKCVELCPLNNIHLENGKPVWGKNCTHCLSCICRCPAEAIEYGNKSQGKPRYHLD